MTCPNCGADFGLSPVTCAKCGARIVPCPTCKGHGVIVTGQGKP